MPSLPTLSPHHMSTWADKFEQWTFFLETHIWIHSNQTIGRAQGWIVTKMISYLFVKNETFQWCHKQTSPQLCRTELLDYHPEEYRCPSAPCCPGPGQCPSVYSGQGIAAQRPVSRGLHTTITSGETCGVLTPLVRIRWYLQTKGVNETIINGLSTCNWTLVSITVSR